MAKSSVTLKKVSFTHPTIHSTNGSAALKGIDLEVKKGEFVVVCGPSGSGKSTLARLINGLIPNFFPGKLEGKVYVSERDGAQLKSYEWSQLVGSVFQDPQSLFLAKTLFGEIAFSSENQGFKKEATMAQVAKLIEVFQLDNLEKRDPFTLSSGEKQKAAIAAAMAVDPQILVLDEPSANLDEKGEELLADALAKLKSLGKTIFVIEHRLHYLPHLADRFIYLNGGIIEEEFSPGALLALSAKRREQLGIRSPLKLKIMGNRIIFLGKDFDESPSYEKESPVNLTGDFEAMEKVMLMANNLVIPFVKSSNLKGLSFTVPKGLKLGVLGRNGCGKSTLGRVLSGILKEKSGLVLLNGKKVRRGARKKFLSFLGGDEAGSTLSDSVENELAINGKGKRNLEELLAELSLAGLKKRHPASLSGGERQRLLLAAAITRSSPALYLDEPTSGMDYKNMIRVANLMSKETQNGRSFLVATHDLEFALAANLKILNMGTGANSDFN